MKIGRNERCWCGSSKKFKYCHLGRKTQNRIDPWETADEFNAAFSAKRCLAPDQMHPECSGPIVAAHTLPKSSSLKKISRDGKVYAYDLKFQNLIMNRGRNEPKLIGISNASTFNGFCSYHDDRIFSPVEKRAFTGTQEQCFALTYRALAREIFTKDAAASLESLLRESDRGRPEQQQESIQFMNLMIKKWHAIGIRDNSHHKSLYDSTLVSGSYDQVRGYVVEFEDPPQVMCSAGLFPEQDFAGNELQDLYDFETPSKMIAFTSFATGDRGAAVFSWLEESNPVCVPFVGSLDSLGDEEISGALLRCMFEFSENVHIAPDWWDGLRSSQRNALVKRSRLSADVKAVRSTNILGYDGVDFEEWKIRSRYTVGY